jgi:hypothetical protein
MSGDEVAERAAAVELAGRFKTEGNKYFKQKHMLAAIDRYTAVVSAPRLCSLCQFVDVLESGVG